MGNSTFIMKHQGKKADSRGEQTPFPCIPSLMGLVLSIFCRKMDGSNPSEIGTEALIPALINMYKQYHEHSQLQKKYSHSKHENRKELEIK